MKSRSRKLIVADFNHTSARPGPSTGIGASRTSNASIPAPPFAIAAFICYPYYRSTHQTNPTRRSVARRSAHSTQWTGVHF